MQIGQLNVACPTARIFYVSYLTQLVPTYVGKHPFIRGVISERSD